MLWINIFIVILACAFAKEETNELNQITKPLPNLDANLRRALLKALTELENEENEKKLAANHRLPHVDTTDKLVEKASASALSFFAPTTEKDLTTTEAPTPKPIVVIQKSHGLQHKPIISQDEQIITSASSSFTSSNFQNLVSEEVKETTKFFRRPKVETTTVTTTTSTEENEAKVEDVQFFSAPLVAAFTVHQDERGLPKSVEPIFRSKAEQRNKETKYTTEASGQLRTQLALAEKQKALEAEILRLKQQQLQQNYLIRQQQLYHQQQLNFEKHKILEQQSKIVNNQAFSPANSSNKGSLVSFQPSISFTSNQHASAVLPPNAQQLPIKTAVEFHAPFASTDNFHQFNYLSYQQPPLEGSFSTFQVAPTVQPPITLTAPKHHRVFRQEASTGNYYNFNNQFRPSQQDNTRFYAPLRAQPPVVNQQLNSLLYNSGLIRGKQQEDLNIVSKVLSLNHYGGDYRFASSNVNEQRVEAPVIKKV